MVPNHRKREHLRSVSYRVTGIGTVPGLAYSGHTQPCLAIVARRTCDCAEFDVELASLLELRQVTLDLYVHSVDSSSAVS